MILKTSPNLREGSFEALVTTATVSRTRFAIPLLCEHLQNIRIPAPTLDISTDRSHNH